MAFKFEELHSRILGIIHRWQTGRIDLVPEQTLRELNCVQGETGDEFPHHWAWFDELPRVGIPLRLLDIELRPITRKLPRLPFYRTDGGIVVIEAPTWTAGKEPTLTMDRQPDGSVTWLDGKGKPIAPGKLVNDLGKFEYTQAIHIGEPDGTTWDTFTITGYAVELAQHWRLTAKGMEAIGGAGGELTRHSAALDKEEAMILRELARTYPEVQTQAELEVGTDLSRKTVANRCNALLEAGLLHKPKGSRGGYGLTKPPQ